MGNDAFDGGFCANSLGYYPIDQIVPGLPHDIGVLMVVTGLVNIVMSLITVGWIKKNELEAQMEDGREEAAKSVIFPVFVRTLWFTIASNIFAGTVTAVVPFDPSSGNSPTAAILYALVLAVRHSINEGIAFLLTQKGCGHHAADTAGRYAIRWGIVTFGMLFYVFLGQGPFTEGVRILWGLLLLSLYLTLWLAPQDQVFRRPAVRNYARFWSLYALLSIIINIFFVFDATDSLGNCAYVLTNVLLIAIFSPLIIYWTLLQDSRWWQGLDITKNFSAMEDDPDSMRIPLLGTDFSLSSAQSLAHTLDMMRVHRVKMLNFACIKIDFRKPLGGGSFSKVYRGNYRGKDCAIKLIYTVDLTADVIQRVAAEASILSSIQHPNIVNIHGVSVLPPSVCLILEICHFGSLSDVIRGYGFDWNTTHRYPLTCSAVDVLYLALGCARGVAAIHALNANICHRDIKSFNFLVDRNFTVKIADLELGLPTMSVPSSSASLEPLQRLSSSLSSVDPGLIVIDDRLANWLAPEVLIDRRFQQASDIYALGTVFWEIVAKRLPFEDDPQPVIREKLLNGYMHPFPPEHADSPLAVLIQQCWVLQPQGRPTAAQIVSIVEEMLTYACGEHVKEVCHPHVNVSAVRDYYESRYRRHSLFSDDRVMGSVFRMSYHQPTWWDRLRQCMSNPWSMLRRDSDLAPDSIASSMRETEGRTTTYALPKVRPMDLLTNHSPPTMAMRAQVPLLVQEAIGQIKTERYWRSLEDTGEAWAAVSVEHPHVVLHATSRWFGMFDACSAFGTDHHLWSLMSLINPEGRAPDHHCSASNTFVASTSLPTGHGHSGGASGGFAVLQMQCANEFLHGLSKGQQTHGTLCFHLLDPQPSQRRPSRMMSTRSRASFSEAGRSGHLMMCTAHAYPVFPTPTGSLPLPDGPPMVAAVATNSEDGSGSVTPPTCTSPLPPLALASTPTDESSLGAEEPARASTISEPSTPARKTAAQSAPSTPSRPKSHSLFSRASQIRKGSGGVSPLLSDPQPQYCLILFNELLEVNVPSERASLRESMSNTALSHTFLSGSNWDNSSRSHSLSHSRGHSRRNYFADHDDENDEEDEEDDEYEDEHEGDEEQGHTLLGRTLGRFWSGTRRAPRAQSSSSQTYGQLAF